MPDLFGEEREPVEPKKKRLNGFDRFKRLHRYRISEDKNARCKCCISLYVKIYHNKYYKCKHIGEEGSAITDIRVNNVCNLFQPKS